MNAYIGLIKREFSIIIRNPWTLLNPLLFFLIAVALFPLAISQNPRLLAQIAPGVIWVLALLALLLTFDHVFGEDFISGALDYFILSPVNLTLLVLIKVLMNWLMSILPLMLIAFPVGLIFNLPSKQIFVLELSLLLGTPVIFLLGSIMAGLVIGLRNNGILLALLVLPLCIPVIIFGTSAVLISGEGLPVIAYFEILGAIFILALCFCPLAISAAVRIGCNQ